MLPPASNRPAGSDAVLAFACENCGTGLEVPASLAGVAGPCPVCGFQIIAPAWTPAVTTPLAERPAELLTRPPRLREMPPPEPRADRTSLRPEPLTAAVEAENTPTVKKAASPQNVLAAPVREARAAVLPPRRAAIAHEARGIFDGRHLPQDDANELVHRRPVPLRRSGWQRWLDLGIVSIFTGLLIACILALGYTVPAQNAALPGLPPNLTDLVQDDTRERNRRQREAEVLADSSVKRFLSCKNEQTAASHLLPPPDGLAMPAFPAFAGTLPDSLAVQNSRRIPGSDRFIITFKPEQAPGPVFVVEETDRGPLLHSGVITQQTAGLFEKFMDAPGAGSETTLYAECRPALPSTEREIRVQNPNLSPYQLVEILPVGKTEAELACVEAGSPAAQIFARRAHDKGWRRCIVTLRWNKDAGGVNFIEIIRFQCGAWSGDFPEKPAPPPVTAGGPR